jgi:lysophospholipase L1-like esterase
MRRSLFLAGVIALPSIALAAGTPRRILVLGDSLALGTGASRADGGFIFPAFRRLLATQPGTLLDNVAIGGSTVADVLRVQVGRVAEFAPDVVIVCVGGNDVVRRTTSAAFARDYAAALRAIRRSAPRARVICCGVPDVAISPIVADERAAVAALSAADDRAAHAAAHDAGARFIDFFRLTQHAGTNDERFFSRDRFHPSDAGYALLTDALWPALRDAVATESALGTGR